MGDPKGRTAFPDRETQKWHDHFRLTSTKTWILFHFNFCSTHFGVSFTFKEFLFLSKQKTLKTGTKHLHLHDFMSERSDRFERLLLFNGFAPIQPSVRLSDSLTGTPDCGCFIFVPVKGYRQSFCNYFSQAFFVLLVKINRSNIDSFVSFRFWREWESHKVYLYSLSAVSFFIGLF